MAMVVIVSAVALSQTPKSGALLEINGSSIDLKIYDSQIHTGTVRTVPVAGTCLALDQIPTDAYVLQGGAPTGCDPDDPFETSQGPGTASLSGGVYTFAITTAYCITGGPFAGETSCTTVGPGTGCNSAGTICASPDTGFLTVKNTSGTPFVGTISLTGTSSGCGAASDTTSDLGAGASVTLALGTPGSPTLIDSSNCGGFNQAQTLTLTNTSTSIAKFGKDDYQITPSTATTGDTLDVLPVPVPAGPTGTETSPEPSSLVFNPGTFSGMKCIPYADFSAPNNPVCVELQVIPNNNDSYIYTVQNDFHIDANSLSGGVGGPALLGHHAVPCPDSGFDLNFFLSYTAPPVGDPLKGSGSGGGSCWVAAFDPSVAAVPVGGMVGFVGFQSPVVDSKINVIKAGSSVPLKWQQFAGDGTAETHLSWCQTGPTTQGGSVCADNSPNPTTVFAPWVFLGTIAITCPNDTVNTATDTSSLAAGKSGFQANTPVDGSYQFNWQTIPKSTGCVALVLQYDTGIRVFQAIFKYSKT